MAALISVVCPLSFTGCEDFVKIDPPRTELIRSQVFTNDVTANATLEGIYQDFFTLQHFANGHYNSGVSSLCGMSADELISTVNDAVTAFTENELSADNNSIMLVWQKARRKSASPSS